MVDTTRCSRLGIDCCPQPKVDFSHRNKTNQIAKESVTQSAEVVLSSWASDSTVGDSVKRHNLHMASANIASANGIIGIPPQPALKDLQQFITSAKVCYRVIMKLIQEERVQYGSLQSIV